MGWDTGLQVMREHWIPLLTEMAREDWLKVPDCKGVRDPPLCPHFEKFLEIQAQACKERERMGLTSAEYNSGSGTQTCTRCKSRYHSKADCKAQFCLSCKSWTCKNKAHRKQRLPPQERDEQENTHCYYCDEVNP